MHDTMSNRMFQIITDNSNFINNKLSIINLVENSNKCSSYSEALTSNSDRISTKIDSNTNNLVNQKHTANSGELIYDTNDENKLIIRNIKQEHCNIIFIHKLFKYLDISTTFFSDINSGLNYSKLKHTSN